MEVRRDLRHRGTASQLLAELFLAAHRPAVVLLQPPRHPERPGAVAKVAPYLAHDGRRRKAAELVLAIGVEAFDRLDEAKEADLHDILERLTTVGEAAGDELHQLGVELDEAFAGRWVPARGVGAEETSDLVMRGAMGPSGNGARRPQCVDVRLGHGER